MDDTFVNVWLDSDESADSSRKDFYTSWINKASDKHADPALFGAHNLRQLYPNHTVISTNAYDLNILSYPGVTATPLPTTPLLTDVLFMPFARRANGVPGILIDQVKIGAFQVVWKEYEFLLYMASYPSAFGNITTHSYIIHDGPEEPARLFLLTIGAWAHELHDEVWVYNQGFWHKDRALWEELQKADWKDVILKDDLKRALQKDINEFFSSEEVYTKLGIAWKRGLIMYGPPGNGKTISLKAILKSCNEKGFTPLYVQSFQNPFKGDQGAMDDVFQQARRSAPSVLVLEDLDSLINDQNRSHFLNQLDGLEGNDGLLIIATTNHYDRLDPGLSSRPSRFDRKFAFNDPDDEERALYAKYWQHKLANNPDVEFPDTLIDSIVELTNGFSFAYLKEAFVSALVTLAGISKDKPPFAELLKQQINDLRKQIGKEEFRRSTNTTGALPTVVQMLPRPAGPASKNERDVRILLDALHDRISCDDPREKIYSLLRQSEPSQTDLEGRRFRDLLDSLSNSVANTSTSSHIYRPFLPDEEKRSGKHEEAKGGSFKDSPDTHPPLPFRDQDSILNNRVYRRKTLSPPGPI